MAPLWSDKISHCHDKIALVAMTWTPPHGIIITRRHCVHLIPSYISSRSSVNFQIVLVSEQFSVILVNVKIDVCGAYEESRWKERSAGNRKRFQGGRGKLQLRGGKWIRNNPLPSHPLETSRFTSCFITNPFILIRGNFKINTQPYMYKLSFSFLG